MISAKDKKEEKKYQELFEEVKATGDQEKIMKSKIVMAFFVRTIMRRSF